MIPGSNKDHPSFLKSFSYAMEGFVTAVKTERNIKVMLVAGVCTIIAGCIVGLDIAEWATIIICCGLVIHGELCNTAMEAITKRYERWLDYSLYHCGLAGICPRARLYLERDSHVRQYAAYR